MDDPAAQAALAAPDKAVTVRKDAPWVRGLLFSVAAALFSLALLIVWNLGWHKWPEAAAGAQIDALKWALVIAVTGLFILVVAFASPWLGRTDITAGPLHVQAEGRE